jgi:hypothetical protein
VRQALQAIDIAFRPVARAKRHSCRSGNAIAHHGIPPQTRAHADLAQVQLLRFVNEHLVPACDFRSVKFGAGLFVVKVMEASQSIRDLAGSARAIENRTAPCASVTGGDSLPAPDPVAGEFLVSRFDCLLFFF